jgi:hypothetical protein
MAENILLNLNIPIDVIPTMEYILLILCDEGRFLEAIPSADRARAGRNGAPGTVDSLVERWEALRLALGARGSLAARGGYVNPASKGARWCPGASHRSIPSLGFARDWQTSDALRRENKKSWLFETVDRKLSKTPACGINLQNKL